MVKSVEREKVGALEKGRSNYKKRIFSPRKKGMERLVRWIVYVEKWERVWKEEELSKIAFCPLKGELGEGE